MKTTTTSLALFGGTLLLVAHPSLAQCPQGIQISADGAGYASFGSAVAASGDVAIAGAPYDDEAGLDAGAAHVLELSGGTLVEVAKLLPPSSDYGQHFGRAVAADGERVLVGSSDNQAAFAAGAGFLYRRTSHGWIPEDTLFVASPKIGQELGTSVALDGDRAALGAPASNLDEGEVFVFEPTANGWVEVARLQPAGPEVVHGFGTTVELDGDRILVGAQVSGGEMAAYVFERRAGTWQQVARLVGHDAAGSNGYLHGIALDGDRAVVALPYEDPGCAYVFERVAGVWTETAKLLGSGDPLFSFGAAVDLRGDRLAVGGLDGQGFGVAEDYVEVFRLRDGAWESEARVTRIEDLSVFAFGESVALWHDSLLVGSPLDSKTAYFQGAVEIFGLPRDARTYCHSTANSTGAPAEMTVGCGSGPGLLPLEASPVPDGPGLFLYATAAASAPAWDGVLCVGASIFRMPVQNASGGKLSYEVDLVDQGPNAGPALLPGSTWYLQAWTRDLAAGGTGANLSSAVRVTLGE